MRLLKYLLIVIALSALAIVATLFLLDRGSTNLPIAPFVGCLPLSSNPLPKSFTVEILENAVIVPQDFSTEGLNTGLIWSKETPHFEIKLESFNKSVGPMNEGYCNYHIIELKLNPEDVWRKLAYYVQYSDSASQSSQAEQITLFSDGEVGISWFNEGYYLSLDAGMNWSYWSLRETIQEDFYYAVWKILPSGEGQVLATTLRSDEQKVYTFETIDKGLTWQLTKEEVLTEN